MSCVVAAAVKMAITIRVNLAVIAAIVVGELVNLAWQSDAFPWGRYESHYVITALIADFTLAVIIEWITRYLCIAFVNISTDGTYGLHHSMK